MKTFALCTAGFVAGVGIAAATQTTVLETLGYAPNGKTAAVSTNLAGSDLDANEEANVLPSAVADKAPSLPESTVLVPAKVEAKKPVAKTETSARTASKKTQPTGREEASMSKKSPAVATKKSETAIRQKATERVASSGSKHAKETKVVDSRKSNATGDSTDKTKTKPTKSKPVGSATKQRVVVAKPPMKEKAKEVAKEASPAQKERLGGKWNVTKAVHAGHEVPANKLKTMLLEFEDDKIVIQQGSKREVAKFESGIAQRYGDMVYSQIVITSKRPNTPPIRGFFYKSGAELVMVWAAPGAAIPNPASVEDLRSARVLTLKQSE